MLPRKTFRAIWANKRSYLACVFLITVGIMMFMSLNAAGEGLELAMLKYYGEYRLADVYAKVDAMPAGAADALGRIEGVSAAEARYVTEARAELPDSGDIITLRLISYSDDTLLNKLLISGEPPAGETDILVNTSFYSANGLEADSRVTLYFGGKGYAFNICGTAMSPEYAYITRGGTDLLPDETGFGIGYVTRRGLGKLTNSSGFANDIVFELADGYTFDRVKTKLEDALSPYGLRELIGKEDQTSYSFLKLEIDGIRTMASALPVVFVAMATFVLYLMMKRVIEQERTQIGALKALGFSNAQILLHYVSYGAVTGIAGGALGFAAGYAVSGVYLKLFLEYFMLPGIPSAIGPKYIAASFFLAEGGGVAGAFFGAVRTMRLTPSEAMRPENPKPAGNAAAGRFNFQRLIFNSRGILALRGIARNRMRSVFLVVGVTFSFGLLAIAGGMNNIVDRLIVAQFSEIQVYGVKLPLIAPVAYEEAAAAAGAIKYVTHAEGLLEFPAELKNKNLSTGAVITGIDANSALYKITDTNARTGYAPPKDGLILSSLLSGKLNAAAGDIITVSSPALGEDIKIAVSRVIEQNLGGGCYMELRALAAVCGIPATATSVILDTDNLPYLKEYLKGGKNVATIEDKDSTLDKYRDMMSMYTSVYLFLQIMCAAVAFAIIYNTAAITLSERKREYATLRVLGMSIKEVCEIINLEYWILSAAGMALGAPFALFLNGSVNSLLETAMMSMPSTLPAGAYITGVIGCSAAVALSNLSAKERIKKFDMAEVLKERE